MLMPLGFISCGDGQSNDEPEPINPTPVTAKDPEGTVVLNVMLDYSVMSGLMLTKNYNLEVHYQYSYSKIYQIGEVANIASINVQPGTITDSQWKKSVGAFVHFGYVYWNSSENKNYKIFIDSEIVNTSGGVMGFVIKYLPYN